MSDYASHLALVRQLRDLGAVKISVGDLHVEFGGLPAAETEEGLLEEDPEKQRREWERLQYFSSRG